VLDQPTILQSREGGADRPLVDIGLGRDLARFERPVVVGGEEPEDFVWDGEVRKFVLTRVLERLSVDGYRRVLDRDTSRAVKSVRRESSGSVEILKKLQVCPVV
jgi:hypothetical protein